MKINRSPKALFIALATACALLLLSTTAQAAQITGAIGFGGLFTPTGGTGLDDATGIDIGFAQVTAAGGDFVPAMGNNAVFNHLDFAPPNTPITPFWTVDAGPTTYSFDLGDVFVDFQDANQLSLSGTGVLMATGFDDTPGIWTFSGDQGNIFFTFSSITSNIPEPNTALLLGLGLVGLGSARRRL